MFHAGKEIANLFSKFVGKKVSRSSVFMSEGNLNQPVEFFISFEDNSEIMITPEVCDGVPVLRIDTVIKLIGEVN